MKKVKLSDGSTRITLNVKTDKCPICGENLSHVAFSWRMFHGEATSTCCGAIYQIKSWYVDPKTNKRDIIDFSNSLDDGVSIYIKIDERLFIPLKNAIDKTGIKDIHNDKVYDLIQSDLEKIQDK